jgi:acyl carrier protein
VRGCVVEFISTDTFETNYSFMEAGLSSLDLVQFRQKLIANFPSHINLPVHFAFNYPTVQDVVQYLFEQLTNCDEDTFTTQQT